MTDYVPGGVLRWEDPPPRTVRKPTQQGASNWKLMADQMRQRPDVWAFLGTGPAAQAQHPRIAGGKTGNWHPAGSFVATTREIDGEVHLWAKYVGPPNPAAAPGSAALEQPAVADGTAVDGGHDDPRPGVGGVDHLVAAEGDRDVA